MDIDIPIYDTLNFITQHMIGELIVNQHSIFRTCIYGHTLIFLLSSRLIIQYGWSDRKPDIGTVTRFELEIRQP